MLPLTPLLHIKEVLETQVGFEPTNVGFADQNVRPLHHWDIIVQHKRFELSPPDWQSGMLFIYH